MTQWFVRLNAFWFNLGTFSSNMFRLVPFLARRLKLPHVQKRFRIDALLVAAECVLGTLWLHGKGVQLPLWWAAVPAAALIAMVTVLEVLSTDRMILFVAAEIWLIGLFLQAALGMPVHALWLRQAVMLAAALAGLGLYYLLAYLPAGLLFWGSTAGSAVLYLIALLQPTKNGTHLTIGSFAVTEILPRLAIIPIVRALTQPRRTDGQRLASAVGIAAVHCIFLTLCNDLGPAIILCCVLFATAVLTQKDVRPLLSLVCFGVAGGTLSLLMVQLLAGRVSLAAKIYRKLTLRMQAVTTPGMLDPQAEGFQTAQAQKALYRADFWGGSRFGKVFVPAEKTDYIVVALVNQMGFAAALCVMLLFILLVILTLMKTRQLSAGFHSVLACSAAVCITVQALLNESMACGILPGVGVTLPWLSLGNSSVAITAVFMAFLCAGVSGAEPSEKILVTDDDVYTMEEVFS